MVDDVFEECFERFLAGPAHSGHHTVAPTRVQSQKKPCAVTQGPADIARHVIGCHSTQETRVQNASDDMAGNICQALPPSPPPSEAAAPATPAAPAAAAAAAPDPLSCFLMLAHSGAVSRIRFMASTIAAQQGRADVARHVRGEETRVHSA